MPLSGARFCGKDLHCVESLVAGDLQVLVCPWSRDQDSYLCGRPGCAPWWWSSHWLVVVGPGPNCGALVCTLLFPAHPGAGLIQRIRSRNDLFLVLGLLVVLHASGPFLGRQIFLFGRAGVGLREELDCVVVRRVVLHPWRLGGGSCSTRWPTASLLHTANLPVPWKRDISAITLRHKPRLRCEAPKWKSKLALQVNKSAKERSAREWTMLS